jgi:signal transduction histidine kinase
MMVRSLAFKLTLAFLLVSLIGVALVAIFSELITRTEFDRLTQEQAKGSFIEQVLTYYQTYGTWQGIEDLFRPGQTPPQAQKPLKESPLRLKFGLVSQEGRVVISTGRYNVGDYVPAEVVAQGTPLKIGDLVIGVVLSANDNSPPRAPLEEEYLARISRALLQAAIGAVVIALAIGIFLTRTLTYPLRELTAATQAMAKGELHQTVPVRSKDELGRLAASFNQMSADLSRANQLRRQMTADIAHDLRTPLTVITGYIEALRDGDLKPTPARFEAMYTEAQHLKCLIEDLRTLSLADAGELPLNRQPVSVSELLARVAAVYQHQAEQQNITLKVHLEPDLPAFHADPERLMQVLGNLVSNALRYTPPGGQIVLLARSQPGAVQVQVQDTGRGIVPAELPHIFNRFYRADTSRQQPNGESGLGLAIARAIVEAHDGAITVESEVDRGTTFTITLPSPASQP